MSKPRPASVLRTLKLVCEALEDRLQPDAGLLSSIKTSDYLPDHILVQFKPEAKPVGLDGTLLTSSLSLVPGLYEVNLPHGMTVAEGLQAYSSNPNVVSSQPDYLVQAEALPNDPLLNQQWPYVNASNPSATINAAAGWDKTTGSGNTIVAVIDTGVDYTHPDLAANMWRNTAEVPGNGIDDDHNGYVDDYYGYNFVNNTGNPMDDSNHGTHVAGILGAVGNNKIGVTGVDWNVRIMALKFLDAGGKGSTSNALRALNYAVQMGATISNNSWTSPAYDSALEAGIRNAGLAGHIYVAAAGNLGQNMDVNKLYPGSFAPDNIVTVGGLDSSNRLAGWSNYGQTVDIAAPGNSIYSTLPKGKYGYMSGTSMATPFVTGALALVRDQNPTWSAQQVIQRVLSTADKLPALNGKISGGRLNLGAALANSVVQPPLPPPPPPADTTGAKVTSLATIITNNRVSGLRVTFSEAIQGSSFDASKVLSLIGPSGALAVTGVRAVAGSTTQFDILFAEQSKTGNYSLTLDTGILDLAGNALNQNGNTLNGEALTDRYTGTVSYTAVNTYAAINLPAVVKDYSSSTFTLNVSDSMTIGAVRVQFAISHGWMSDMIIKLRSPSGVEVLLVNRRGGGGKGFNNTILDDAAAKSIQQGTGLFVGSFRPEQALSLFKNSSTAGTWSLIIDDKAKGDGGLVQSWSLSFDAASAGSSSINETSNNNAPRSEVVSALQPKVQEVVKKLAAIPLIVAKPVVSIPVPAKNDVAALPVKNTLQQQKQQLLEAWQKQLALVSRRA